MSQEEKVYAIRPNKEHEKRVKSDIKDNIFVMLKMPQQDFIDAGISTRFMDLLAQAKRLSGNPQIRHIKHVTKAYVEEGEDLLNGLVEQYHMRDEMASRQANQINAMIDAFDNNGNELLEWTIQQNQSQNQNQSQTQNLNIQQLRQHIRNYSKALKQDNKDKLNTERRKLFQAIHQSV